MATVDKAFANSVAKLIGVDNSDGWFTEFLTEWARWEGATSAFNPLATTQSMPGATSYNSSGVKNYTNFKQGVEATAKTLTNKYYPDLMKALRTRDFSDVRGITSNIRTWGTIGFANVIGTGDFVPRGTTPATGQAAIEPADGGTEMGISPRLEPGPSGTVGGLADVEEDSWQSHIDVLTGQLNVVMANAPQFADFSDDDFGTAAQNYDEAYSSWLEILGNTQAALRNFQLMEAGWATLPDGTLIPMGEMEPEKLQALIDSNTNAYAQLQNEYSVGQYNLDTGYQNQQFRSDLDSIAAKNTLDRTGIDATGQAIDRILNGQAESRARSSFVTNSLADNAGMITGPAGANRTEFSLGGFGGTMGQYMAAILGINPDEPFINLTGNVRLDPQGLLEQYDKSLGVEGRVPDAFKPSQTAADVPSAPRYDAPPQLIPPVDSGANITQSPSGSSSPVATNQAPPAGIPAGSFDPFTAFGPYANPAPASFADTPVYQGGEGIPNDGAGWWESLGDAAVTVGKPWTWFNR